MEVARWVLAPTKSYGRSLLDLSEYTVVGRSKIAISVILVVTRQQIFRRRLSISLSYQLHFLPVCRGQIDLKSFYSDCHKEN